MQYEIQVSYNHTPNVWKHYGSYQTMQETMRIFHRLEGHEALANVRVLKDGEDTGIRAR